MNGLLIIESDEITSENIECDNLIVNLEATAPTLISTSNDNHIATTAFVNNAISGAGSNYVTTNTTQTITGDKTFTGGADFLSLSASYISNTSSIDTPSITSGLGSDDLNVGANQTSGVDSVSSGSLLTLNNTWTGTNNFKDVVYVNNPSATKTLILKSTNQNITMTTGSANQQSSGASFNCNTITVPIDNTENLITVTIPFNIAGFGSPIIYPIGTVTLTYSSFSVNILKNGASYSGSSPSATLYNYDSLLREWDCPSGTVKSPSFYALLGNIKIPITLDIGNTSTDIYTINLSVTGTATHSAGGVYTMIFNVLTTGATNFTTTHTANTTSAIFLNIDPSYIPYGKLLGDNGVYLSANNTLNLESSSTIEFLSSTNFNSVLPQSTLTPLNNSDLATKIYIDNAISQAINALTPATNPIGTIIMRASSAVPAGYLYCDGTIYSTVAYPSLWSVIFYTYGGSGPNFRVPDYRACFIRGFGSSTVSGTTYTAPALGTVQQDSVLALSAITNQGYWNIDAGGGGASRQVKSRVRIATDPIDSGAFGAGIDASFPRQNTTENRPLNQSIYYFIKF